MGRSQPSMTCGRARGKVTAVGDGKKTGWAAFRVGHSYLRNYGLAWRTTGGAANGGRLTSSTRG